MNEMEKELREQLQPIVTIEPKKIEEVIDAFEQFERALKNSAAWVRGERASVEKLLPYVRSAEIKTVEVPESQIKEMHFIMQSVVECYDKPEGIEAAYSTFVITMKAVMNQLWALVAKPESN